MTNAEWMQQTGRRFSNIAVMKRVQRPHYVIFHTKEVVGYADMAQDHITALTAWLDAEHEETEEASE